MDGQRVRVLLVVDRGLRDVVALLARARTRARVRARARVRVNPIRVRVRARARVRVRVGVRVRVALTLPVASSTNCGRAASHSLCSDLPRLTSYTALWKGRCRLAEFA